MLVLSRRSGEAIQIGPDITITICWIRRGDVRIGVDAPRELRISRVDNPESHTHENNGRCRLTRGHRE